MIEVCAVCAVCYRKFETEDRRKKYCSKECARLARNKQNVEHNHKFAIKQRRNWAYQEAEYLNHLAYECGVDELAEYIYNNYNKRKQ